MTSSVHSSVEARASGWAPATALPLFAATLFLSAALLFSVQPLFAKLVLPILGGSPSVWSVAMVFFQGLLLAGYAYAHLLTRACPPRTALVVHLAVMACAFAALPIAIPAGWGKPPEHGEALWLLGLFSVAIGLPFLAVSANGPLLQAWFARSGHRQAGDPYFLYAASNVGSFAALLLYPLAIEPLSTLRLQAETWTLGFAVLAGLIALCGLTAGREPPAAVVARAAAERAGAGAWGERLAWTALSFVPSGLLVAVTAHVSTDVAAVPLLWVIPLALFLLTFVLSFREALPVPLPALALAQVLGTALVLLTLPFVTMPLWISLPLHLLTFFAGALVCHAALYARRPPPARLTEFYLFMSLGGVLGGAFCGLMAPRLFSTVIEYPILLVVALACRPGFLSASPREWMRDASVVAAIWGGLLTAASLAAGVLWPATDVRVVLLAVAAVGMAVFWRRPPLAAAPAVAAVLIAAVLPFGGGRLETMRSFFGVHKLAVTEDGRFLTLAHGTTYHGAIRLLNDDGSPAEGRPEPTTYYTPEGALGTLVSSIRAAHGGVLGSAAVIGLGSGSMACHAAPAERWTFLEIDSKVVEIARTPRYFRFLSDCAPDAEIVIGDARLTLVDQPGGRSLIVVDAFSSDAIPAHLITKEAIGLYLAKLGPTGSIVVHISNRHLDLAHILARTAADHGLAVHVLNDRPEEPFERRLRSPSIVAVLTRDPDHLGPVAHDPALRRVHPDMARRPWTDDFTNIVEAIVDKWSAGRGRSD